MKYVLLIFCASMLCVPAPLSATHDDVTAPIRQFVDAFNKGDTQAAFATYAKGDLTVIDEFAPHVWNGTRAAQDWAADFDENAAATGVTDSHVKYGPAYRIEIEGDVAYVVMPTGYTYKLKGVPMEEKAQLVTVLHKEAAGWKIRSCAWTGLKPHAAKWASFSGRIEGEPHAVPVTRFALQHIFGQQVPANKAGEFSVR
ncbi:MAG TPA: nuclear transport factor 2 family protein [Terracidiphilus sp.]|jgi:ketosteroid isomerase-like protein|nr:nuclear transport factor 2 family protein [Terracidiphilus sp.]